MTTTAAGQTGTIRPFTVTIPQEALDDLQRRLANTRYPVAAPADSWDYGTPVAYLQKMITAWQQFDWRGQEARMNSVPNFVTEIDDQTCISSMSDPASPRPPHCCSRTHIPGLSLSSST